MPRVRVWNRNAYAPMNSNDRVHACLDGELPLDALTPAEQLQLADLRAAIEEIGAAVLTAPVPDLTARVMAALPRPAPVPSFADRLAAALGWLWQPRTFTFRPAYAFAGMATLVLVLVYAPQWARLEPGAAARAVAPQMAGTGRVYVQFRLEAPGASQVQLAGSFTGWKPSYELHEGSPGVWTALVPLNPGVYDYTFVVDGQRWVPDPDAPQVDDSFGGTNSRLFLPSPGGSV